MCRTRATCASAELRVSNVVWAMKRAVPLMLQMLHPRVLAGVWDHSSFRDNMNARLKGTEIGRAHV